MVPRARPTPPHTPDATPGLGSRGESFPNGSQQIGKPSVRNSATDSVLLSLTDAPAGGSVAVKVVVQPMIVWLWIGGGVMAVGSLMAAFPGRRRRPIDPVSAPVPDREPVGAGAS